MSSFDEREKAFEKKFQHDQEMQFKAEMRRNKLAGLWAAELLGKTGDDADDYAKEVIAADFEEPGPEDVIRKLMTDFQGAGVDIEDHKVRRKLEELFATAKEQLMAESA